MGDATLQLLWADSEHVRDGKCQLCGHRGEVFRLEAHHNTYRRRQRWHDFIWLCSAHHAHYEYVKKHWPEIWEFLTPLRRTSRGVDLDSIRLYYQQAVDRLAAAYAELDDEVDCLLAMVDGQRYAEDLRRAA